jgi:hypothetical protein
MNEAGASGEHLQHAKFKDSSSLFLFVLSLLQAISKYSSCQVKDVTRGDWWLSCCSSHFHFSRVSFLYVVRLWWDMPKILLLMNSCFSEMTGCILTYVYVSVLIILSCLITERFGTSFNHKWQDLSPSIHLNYENFMIFKLWLSIYNYKKRETTRKERNSYGVFFFWINMVFLFYFSFVFMSISFLIL